MDKFLNVTSRTHSQASSLRSHLSGHHDHGHTHETGGASTSHAPTGGDPQPNGSSNSPNSKPSEDKPHTLSDIAHRAIGDHRRPEGDDGLHDRFQSGGDHPGLDRNQASGHYSHSMPGSALTKARKRELYALDQERKEGDDGERGSAGGDRKGKGRARGDEPRDDDEVHDDGDSSDGMDKLKDGEGQDPATRHAARALRDAVGGDLDPSSSNQTDSDLKGHAGGRRTSDREDPTRGRGGGIETTSEKA
jgi:hypothetical protein